MPFSSLVILLLVESAKLRALRTLVPYVPCGLGALVPYVRLCLTCLVPYVLSSPPSLASYMLLCPVYLASDMLLCLTCSCAPCTLRQTCSCALHAPVFHVTCVICGLVSRTLWALFPYVTNCFVLWVLYVLITPFVLLSFHASRSYFSVNLLLVIFRGKSTKVKTNIVFQYYLKWQSVFINSMIYLNYLKPNTRKYTYETANYFGTGEGEFKV